MEFEHEELTQFCDEDDDLHEAEDENHYYQCMSCGNGQEKFNGGSCQICANPVNDAYL